MPTINPKEEDVIGRVWLGVEEWWYFGEYNINGM
jgi:hypothetical protein